MGLFAQTYAGDVAGIATVDAIRGTDTMINNAPVRELDLTVSVQGREPYRVTHRQALAQAALARLRPGASVPVRVDRNDPSKLVFG